MFFFNVGTVVAEVGNDISEISVKLAKRSPPISPKSISPTPIPGIYEVFVDGAIYYMDKSTTYVFLNASLVDDKNKKNLTYDRINLLSQVIFSDLPIKNAIEIKRGSGFYKFAIFSDPDCPSCRTLESEVENSDMTNFTAYIFLFPLRELHPDAAKVSEYIWCSQDRVESWKNLMLKGILPEPSTCNNPVNDNEKLAQELGVKETPTIYLSNGKKVNNFQELFNAIKLSNNTVH
jgi:thiol:disulfide interchange protein DsbC